MLNREERGGLLWIGLFLGLLVGGVIFFIVRADPTPPRVAQAHRTPLKIGAAAGQLVHARTGQPVGPALVSVQSLEGRSAHWLEPPDVQHPGAFCIRGLPAGGPYRLRLSAEGFETVERQVEVRAGETDALGEIRLRPRVTCSGRVVDAKGLPQAGATVHVQGLDDANGTTTLRTNSSGVFEVVQVAGPIRVRVTQAGSRSRCTTDLDLWNEASAQDVRLEVTATVSVHGRVDSPAPPTAVGGHDQLAPIAADGSFMLAEQLPGAGWLELPGQDGESTAVLAWCSANRPLRLSLPAPVVRSVRVEGATPGRLRLAAVSEGPVSATTSWVSRFQTETGDLDALAVHLRPGVRTRLLAWQEDGALGIRELGVQELEGTGGEEAVVLTLTPASAVDPIDRPVRVLHAEVGPVFDDASWPLPREVNGDFFVSFDPRLPWAPPAWWDPAPSSSAPLVGRVLGADGQAVAGARVSVMATCDGHTRLMAQSSTNAAGEFHIERPSAHADLSLVVEARNMALDLQPVGGGNAPMEVVLTPGHELALRCVDEADQPLHGVVVQVALTPALPADPAAPHLRGLRTAISDEEGMIRFHHLTAADWMPSVASGQVPVETVLYPATLPAETLIQPLVLQPQPEN